MITITRKQCHYWTNNQGTRNQRQSGIGYRTSHWRYCLLCKGELKGRWWQQPPVNITPVKQAKTSPGLVAACYAAIQLAMYTRPLHCTVCSRLSR